MKKLPGRTQTKVNVEGLLVEPGITLLTFFWVGSNERVKKVILRNLEERCSQDKQILFLVYSLSVTEYLQLSSLDLFLQLLQETPDMV